MYVVALTALLADALYEQGRLDEAQQLVEDASAERLSDMLADLQRNRGEAARPPRPIRRGTPPGRRGRGARVTGLAPSTQADVLRTRAEVERLAGAPGQAAVSLRAALDIYQQQRATALAEQVRAALASLRAGQV